MAAQCLWVFSMFLVFALSSICPVQTEGRGQKAVWTCYSWTLLSSFSSCFIQRCYFNCTGYSSRDEGTVLSWKVLKPSALLHAEFCEHFKAGAVGATSDIRVIFCHREWIMLKSCPFTHLGYPPNKNIPITCGVGDQIKKNRVTNFMLIFES